MSEMISARFAVLWFLFAAAAISAAFVTAETVADNQTTTQIAATITGGERSRALPIFRKYGCSGCHTIGGVPGADGKVGPELTSLAQRVFIAGVMTNTSDNLVNWIVAPEMFSPHTAMPTTGITAAEARDLAAYLYAH